ncbi:phage minor head protein [Petrimonas sulfuriphila]|uniref:phage minor head protein n=1 Tax=Petrimonas sulfuriphila TaxID=285070 RepID=UPI003EB7510D
MTEIDEGLFNEFWDIYNDATDKGFESRQHSDPDFDFYNELRRNNGVFAAFKTHRFQNDMAAQLLDRDGKLKSFAQWEDDTQDIRDHHVKHWLETEYNTAVKRAHISADWRQFEREKDILPNLEWVKTTAITPGKDHVPFWGMIRPVGDPVWNEHRPGDRWGCKCGLRSTDKPVTQVPEEANSPVYKPAPGLDNNPGKDAMLYSFSHPYFALGYMTYKKLSPIVKKFVQKQIEERKKLKEFKRDKVAGKRLLIHERADISELEDNKRAGRTLVENFPKMKIRVREHIRNEDGIKNPEYEINGLLADAKRVESSKGITAGFVTAKGQGCSIVIIDFDKHLLDKEVNRIDVARRIGWRSGDFESGTIKECYIVHNGKAFRITKKNYDNRAWIVEQLKKSGM